MNMIPIPATGEPLYVGGVWAKTNDEHHDGTFDDYRIESFHGRIIGWETSEYSTYPWLPIAIIDKRVHHLNRELHSYSRYRYEIYDSPEEAQVHADLAHHKLKATLQREMEVARKHAGEALDSTEEQATTAS